MRIGIIGSCVTRDIWQVLNLNTVDLHFTARTSLISQMSPPLASVERQFCEPPSSAFERRCLEVDVAKTALADLEQFEPERLLFDFIDERFDVLQVGPSFILYSAELQLAGGLAMKWLRPATLLDRVTPQTTWLWIKSAQYFLGSLANSAQLRHVPILLHRAPWARRRVDGRRAADARVAQADLHEIAPGKVVNVRQYDMLMRCYYEIFQALSPQTVAIEVPGELHLAADAHIWGPSPFHYVDEYYEAVGTRLRSLGLV